MKKVYICSPYRADTKEKLRENVEAAKRLSRRAALEGNLVFCPHLCYPQFLNDCDEAEREMGMKAGLELLGMADEVWMLAGAVSAGMAAEIAKASELGIPVITMCDPMVAEEHLLAAIMCGED